MTRAGSLQGAAGVLLLGAGAAVRFGLAWLFVTVGAVLLLDYFIDRVKAAK